jgi:hypothetical protein
LKPFANRQTAEDASVASFFTMNMSAPAAIGSYGSFRLSRRLAFAAFEGDAGQQFAALSSGLTKVRYCSVKKNAARVQTLFPLSNIWMVRRKLLASAA